MKSPEGKQMLLQRLDEIPELAVGCVFKTQTKYLIFSIFKVA